MATFAYTSRVVAQNTTDNNNMTQGTEDVCVKEDGEPQPTKYHDDYFIYERGRDSRLNTDGKWMLFYLNQNINAAWIKAKTLLRKGNIKSLR